ncbi:hypothetical protein ACWDTP_19280 [Mycobacterium sp. NPDC003449]
MEDSGGLIGHIHDAELGDVLVLRRPHLPSMTVEMAAEWLIDQGIPTMTVGTITKARHRGELKSTVIGRNALYSEHDLLGWIQGRHANSEEHFAKRSKAIREGKAARKKAGR